MKNAVWTVKKYCRKKSTNRWLGKKIKKRWTLHIEQTKSNVVFTHSPNKCYNTFTKHLFSVVVGHSFIFYYFILTYKKLTPQQLWKYCEICCVSITIYMQVLINI